MDKVHYTLYRRIASALCTRLGVASISFAQVEYYIAMRQEFGLAIDI